MKSSLRDLKKAIKGLIVMTEELEIMSVSLYDNQVPRRWSPSIGHLSLKPLASWIEDLKERIVFL